MVKVKDNISGTIHEFISYNTALKVAKDMVKEHNSEYDYGHRGHHYSANCTLFIDGNIIVIDKEVK